ncbi:MAG: GntR family transcriptional regulator [Anaerolineae bacterium]|jgi:GntR family transcriptional regulator|nr:GntR family transcriptional regulator [Anaerolineae bacterium]MBT7189855.1 GntR family transcriptional regulator [Anaerolineae bacterium]MBT7991360.1 GntR family transcriptional regulator [Anaerolineae bacterium]
MMLVTRSKSIVEQVNEVLRERIRNATYAPGLRLPSENGLAEEFGVSRATIRTVLAKLSVEGLILRRQGDGTYVNERILEVNTHLGGLWDFSRLIESSGFSSSIKALSLQETTATEEDARILAIKAGDKLLWMKRLFLADEKPVILANNFIPCSFLNCPVEEINGQLHIREILQRYFQQRISFAVTEISSSNSKESFNELGNELSLNLKMTFYSEENQPLALGNSYFNDTFLRLRLVQAWA